MGTWGVKIDQNDTYLDVADAFLNMISNGINPLVAAFELKNRYRIYPDENNVTIALADSLWRCNAIDSTWVSEVMQLRDSGKDRNYWRENGADIKTLNRRSKELDCFIDKISTTISKNQLCANKSEIAKAFSKGDCFWYRSKGKVYGALIVDIVHCYYLVGVSEAMNSFPEKVDDVLTCPIFTAAWFSDIEMLTNRRCHMIGSVLIQGDYNGYCGLYATDGGGVKISNVGQHKTWSHEFSMLRLTGRMDILFDMRLLPKIYR